MSDPIYSEALARQVGVSVRSMHDAVRRFRGMSLHRYLRLRRLWLVRKQLLVGTQSVKACALAFGFWHLGDFSASYRLQFGNSLGISRHRAPTARRRPWGERGEREVVVRQALPAVPPMDHRGRQACAGGGKGGGGEGGRGGGGGAGDGGGGGREGREGKGGRKRREGGERVGGEGMQSYRGSVRRPSAAGLCSVCPASWQGSTDHDPSAAI